VLLGFGGEDGLGLGGGEGAGWADCGLVGREFNAAEGA